MKKRVTYLWMAVFMLVAVAADGQRKSDIGFMVSVPWYLGDIRTQVPQPTLIPPAIGPIFRYNFGKRISLRAHSLFYDLSGSGTIFEGEHAEFESSFVDLGLDFEFNWWDYKTAWRKTKYSPYVTAGLGYSLNYDGGSVSHLFIPFGGGLKANLGKKLSGGVEVAMRKTFTDRIDGVTNVGGEEVESPIGNNDWYMFTGVFITYKIFEYRDDCPTYGDEKKKSKNKKRARR